VSTNKDGRFLCTAMAVASIWSKDPRTRVGAVAVGETPNLVAFGYNGLPPGIDDSNERLNDRETKLKLTLHAEVNALANATFPVHTIYVTHCPCDNCALHILAARTVRRVVYLVNDEFESRWAESLDTSRQLLREGGIAVTGVRL
jgi:dCMP deaminase